MSPTAKHFKEKKEEEEDKKPAAVLLNSSPSSEEFKSSAKRSRPEEEEPKKLPPLFYKKFKVPVIPRVYKEEEIPVELLKKRANKSIEESLRNIERVKDLGTVTRLLNQEVTNTQAAALFA